MKVTKKQQSYSEYLEQSKVIKNAYKKAVAFVEKSSQKSTLLKNPTQTAGSNTKYRHQ